MRPLSASQPLPRAGLVVGLAEQPAVERDVRVDAEHDRPLPRPGLAQPGSGLAPGVLEHDRLRLALAELLDLGDYRLEHDPEALEDLPPAWRRRGEDQALTSYSPNQIPISRSADSSESEPWTRLNVTSSP